jgi:L-ascorbate metabolism protein UlaG (beta-lactamase superfamily)
VATLECVRWPVAEWSSLALTPGEAALWWLGQSGFAVRHESGSFLIDPYLSNSLAKKYAGTNFPHVRMMPIPAAPESVSGVDLVLCTHRHTDHMDPETLAAISRNERVRFVVPSAIVGHAVEKAGLDPSRIIPINAGETVEPNPGIRIAAVPAAHEELEVNAHGEYLALGYVVHVNGIFTLYHSGDCIPYEALKSWLDHVGRIDVGILPVNGRDAKRTAAGVLGNFTIDEALAISADVPFQQMIVAHFGMFDFNTVDPVWLRRRISETKNEGKVLVPEMDVAFKVRVQPQAASENGNRARRGPAPG